MSTPPPEPIYTAAECRAEIKAIDALIAKFRRLPAQVSARGLFTSTMGKGAELAASRRLWEMRLKEALAYERALIEDRPVYNAIQGPDIHLE